MTRDLRLYVEDILASIVLIHQYFGVNLHRTWLVVKEDLPTIKAGLMRVHQDLANDGGEAQS